MSDDLGTGPDMPAMLTKPHDTAQAMFKHTSQELTKAKAVAAELGGLTKLGDMVTMEDVIKGAGKLVSGGTHSAQEVATSLAELPPTGGGQALAAWVQQRSTMNQKLLTQLAQFHSLSRHELGVSALRLLAAHALPGAQQAQTASAASSQGGVNPLMGNA